MWDTKSRLIINDGAAFALAPAQNHRSALVCGASLPYRRAAFVAKSCWDNFPSALISGFSGLIRKFLTCQLAIYCA
jgi:L-asparaginase II